MENNFGLNKLQSLRLAMLRANSYDIEKAAAAFDFVVGANAQQRLRDGVYFITKDGTAILFVGETRSAPQDVEYIGIVQGDHSVAVALTDMVDYDVTLTNDADKTGEKQYYIESYQEAVQDYDGETNTQNLCEIGLNSRIKLKDGEYIPSLGELCLICLNQHTINEALKFIGGQPLSDDWYWSSTERSAANPWLLCLCTGGAGCYAKDSNKNRVRAVTKFPN